jgi:hypothetical protein
MRLSEIKKLDVPRDQNGVALRGVAREIAIRKRQADKEFKDYDITDNMAGVGKLTKIKEQALETKVVEDLWDENSDAISEYVSTTIYQVRPIPDTKPTLYEVFSVLADKSTPFGKFNAAELAKTLKPIRPNQTPDVEGFTTYIDPLAVEAFKYTGEPIKLELDDQTVQLDKGDYVIRAVKGSSFTFSSEDAITFESTLKKS